MKDLEFSVISDFYICVTCTLFLINLVIMQYLPELGFVVCFK